MSSEFERSPKFTVLQMTANDVQPANDMRLQSWLDTYVNDAAGVTEEWIKERNQNQNSPEKVAARISRLGETNRAAWVAKDDEGKVIGVTTPYIDDEGRQHVGSLYVDKEWHGKGVGGALMEKVIDWFDPTKPIELGVAAYNERAKAFYRKWGFEEAEGSEALFAERIPGVMMIRKGDKR